MDLRHGKSLIGIVTGFLSRLAHDRAGNTLMIVAFSLVPIIAMLGGGIDMGRSYLSQSRLQQACDSGVLAARKTLGGTAVASNVPTSDVRKAGDRFFDINFQSGSYGTVSRTFAMNVEADSSVSGTASVSVPTTLMKMFGFNSLALSVKCEAKVNFSNADIMMVLDTTGSMGDTNPGDKKPKIEVLRDTVKAFYTKLEAAKGAGTRLRYGFVPYSANVNVASLLKSDWMVDTWKYHGREARDLGTAHSEDQYSYNYTFISGTYFDGKSYTAATCPTSAVNVTYPGSWTDPDGTQHSLVEIDGTGYYCSIQSDGEMLIQPYTYAHYIYQVDTKKTGTIMVKDGDWHYYAMPFDVSLFKDASGDNPPHPAKITVKMGGSASNASNFDAWNNGCIEERDTYEINDYANVDFTRALDLDIDRVPTLGVQSTQWRPSMPDLQWDHSVYGPGDSSFNWTPGGDYYNGDFFRPSGAYSACPAPASKLATMTKGEIDTYLDTLTPAGGTYHDIGMIWGGRLISPTGLFAAENADTADGPTNRNLIFLTDGLTAPREVIYGTYGIEPLDQRRWSTGSALTLTETVEKRFGVACSEVKKRNITVWIIGFGQSLNPVLTNCAGPGHSFYASDGKALTDIFNTIAASMGNLRVSK